MSDSELSDSSSVASGGSAQLSLPPAALTPSSSGGSVGAGEVGGLVPSNATSMSLPAASQQSPLSTFAPSEVSSGRYTSFGRVSHSFAALAAQVGAGLARLQQVCDFTRSVCAAKQRYAADLLKTSATYGGEGIQPLASSAAHSPQSHPLLSPRKDKRAGGNDAAHGGGGVGEAAPSVLPTDDAMSGASGIWTELRSSLFEEARQEQEFATKVLEEVCSPLARFHAEADRKRRLVLAHHAALSGQVRGLSDQLLAAKVSTVKALAALQAAEAREREATTAASLDPDAPLPPPPPASSKGDESKGGSTRRALASVGSFFKGLSRKGDKEREKGGDKNGGERAEEHSAGESSEELRERAYQAALAYALAVQSCNARASQWWGEDLPQLVAELQRLEVARINALKHHLSLLAGANLSLVSPNKQRLQSLLQSVTAIEAEQECAQFVEQIVAQVGETAKPNEYAYDLQWQPEEIRQARMNASGAVAKDSSAASADAVAAAAVSEAPDASSVAADAPSKLFGLNLDSQMDAQVESHPQLDVPVAFHTLLSALKKRQAFNKPNLFFLAADSAAVESVRARLERGETELKGVGVELLAATLKLWLRSLPQPLLPAALYPAALSAVKKEHAATQSASATEDLSPAAPVEAGAEEASAGKSPSVPLSPSLSPAPTEERGRAASASSASASASSSSSSMPSPQLHHYCMSIISALPTLNQRVLTHLASFVSECAAATAMVAPSRAESKGEESAASPSQAPTLDLARWAANMTHAASVFTPVVLRSAHADTTELLSNAPKEARFTAALFISLTQSSQAVGAQVSKSGVPVSTLADAVAAEAVAAAPSSASTDSVQSQVALAHASNTAEQVATAAIGASPPPETEAAAEAATASQVADTSTAAADASAAEATEGES